MESSKLVPYTVVAQNRLINYRLYVVVKFIWNAASSIHRWMIFDAYLLVLARSLDYKYANTVVGLADSALGMAGILVAFPIGWLVDRYRRIGLLRSSTLLGAIAISVLSLGILSDSLRAILVAQVLLGAFIEFHYSLTSSLFADSLPPGERTSGFLAATASSTTGKGAGVLVLILLFLSQGKQKWEPQELHMPLMIGMSLYPPILILLMCYKDPHPEVACPESAQGDLHAPPAEAIKTPHAKWVPPLLALSGFVHQQAITVAVKFFGLFFITGSHFSPLQISTLYVLIPGCCLIAQFVVKKCSDFWGRAHTVFRFQALSACCLLAMCWCTNTAVLVTLFLIQVSTQPSCRSINESIMNDHIPSVHRGFWNSVDSVAFGTTSISCALGGWLSDVSEYRAAFFASSAVLSLALAFYCPLLWWVTDRFHAEPDLYTPLLDANEKEVVPNIREVTP